MTTIAYAYSGPMGESIYLNITNRCPVACVFCVRHVGNWHLAGYDLRLESEPSAAEIERAAQRLMAERPGFHEVVFCGMGEPLMRPEVVVEVAGRLRERGARVRVDTCGLGNLVHGRDLTVELGPVVDAVSISLNAENGEHYAQVCPSRWGAAAFDALLEFIALARERFRWVGLSVVHPNAYARQGLACPIDVEACRRLAVEIGLPLRIRGR